MPEPIKQHIMETIQLEGRILEMSSDNETYNVPVDPRIDIGAITGDDPSPKFVNVEVVRSRVKSGNRRRYGNNVITEINNMTPGLQGFLGHPDPSKYGFEFREPQCIYVGAKVQEMEDGSNRSIAKAYLFKSSPLREWVPASIAAGKPMTVSINGAGDVLNNGDTLDVVHMTELQSIDWANPGTEGMGTSQAMSVVSEMQNNLGGNNMPEMTAQEIIKNATVTEFRAFNPQGFSGVVASVTLQELQANNPSLFNEIQRSGAITEMNVKVDGADKTVKLTEMQGIIDAKEVKIAELTNQMAEQKLELFKSAKLTELVSDSTIREKIAKRVSGKTEDEITTSINNEIAYIREMGGNGFDNPPAPAQGRPAGEMKDLVANMFGAKISK